MTMRSNHTLCFKFSRSGLTSARALIFPEVSVFFSTALSFFCNSASALMNASSTGPSEMAATICGGMETFSTAGPRSFSTFLRFSNRLFKAVERFCSVSISVETAPRSR